MSLGLHALTDKLCSSHASRVSLLRIALSLACLSCLLLSHKLWLSERYYPLTPISEKLRFISPPFDYILFLALLVLLVIIAIQSRPLKPIFAYLVLASFLCLSDQSRLQPWFYQFTFMLAAFAFYFWRRFAEHNQLPL